MSLYSYLGLSVVTGSLSQTLVADWAACSLKLCSNSSLCLTSTCFCWNLNQNWNCQYIPALNYSCCTFNQSLKWSQIHADALIWTPHTVSCLLTCWSWSTELCSRRAAFWASSRSFWSELSSCSISSTRDWASSTDNCNWKGGKYCYYILELDCGERVDETKM